jgi:threonine dehydrogenase-like Zn-dependent dehydrogenase
MGAGPIGLSIMLALKARGISNIIAVDTNTTRREAAILAGAHNFVDPREKDLGQVVMRLCKESKGAHVAFDTAGKQVTLDQCVATVCMGGTIVNVAIWGGSASIVPNTFALAEKRYMGTSVYTRKDFDAVIEAVGSGEFDPPRRRHPKACKYANGSRYHQPSVHDHVQNWFV